jgi:hypothetical protein
MSWKTFKQRIPHPHSRVLVWLPRQKCWELATLTGRQFTLLSGAQVGTLINWREISHFLEVEDPAPRRDTK